MKYTTEQIAVLSRHAAERAQLVAEQQNERVAMEERQAQELADVGIKAPAVPMEPRKGP